MKKFSVPRWFRDISITKKLYFVVGLMALLIVMELLVLVFSINTLSSVRAYVGAEGLWSKAQKDAIYDLQKYARTGKQKDYQEYLDFLKIPLGDRVARIEMAKENPDYDIMRNGFLQGGIHPDDIDGMIKLFRRFHSISYINKAIAFWTAGDSLMVAFQKVANDLHTEIKSSNVLTNEILAANFNQIDEFNTKFTVLENNFSSALGEGSRWLEGLILKILLAIALTVEISGLLLTIIISRNISISISAILKASQQIALGNFKAKAIVYSQDEIGQLACSFNNMTDKIEQNILCLKEADEKILDTEKQYLKIFESNPVAMTISEIKPNLIKYANTLFCTYFGYTKSEVIDHTAKELNLISPKEKERLGSVIQNLLNENRSIQELEKVPVEEAEKLLTQLNQSNPLNGFEAQYTRKNGETFFAIVSYEIISIGDKKYTITCYQDITERKKAEAAMHESEEKYLKIFDNNPIPMTFGEIGTNKINYANNHFYSSFGYSKEEVIGHTSEELNLVSQEENERLLPIILASLNESRSVEELKALSVEETLKLLEKLKQEMFRNGFEVKYTKKNGETFFALVFYEIIEIGNKNYSITCYKDISERKKVELELKKSNEEKAISELALHNAEKEKIKAEVVAISAEKAMNAKQQFLANMSHEIRTPMNSIIGFTKVMLKSNLSEKQKEYLTAIKVSGDGLIVLINDILDLAKVNAGKIAFEQNPFNMAESISSVVFLFDAKVKEKNLELIKEYDSKIPNILIGDSARLHQILLNLLSNALKFTSKGKIILNVQLLNEDPDSVTIEFSVMDTGIGISENKIQTVFESFEQASSSTSRLYGGTGLGLAITKQLVQRQGGTITVKSKIDEGSTFSFILSFQKTTDKQEVKTETVILDKEVKGLKVLVVEDNLLNQLLMRTLLDDFGFDRDIAADGKIAIEKLETKSYDIILMDIQMPVMNGFEATEYIRNTMNSNIPIIALTADVSTEDIEKCNSVGMNDYIAKPIDENLLYNKIVALV